MSSKDIYYHQLPIPKNFKTKILVREDNKYEPFVYIIQNTKTKQKYIGCKTARNCLESDLGTKYFTSSNIINKKWKNETHLYEIIEIISCASNHSALILEDFLLKKFDAVASKDYLNRSRQGKLFNNSGVVFSNATRSNMSKAMKKRIENGYKPKISDETRKRISENRKKFNESLSDAQRKEKYGHSKNKGRKCSEETKIKISKSRKNFKHTQESKDKISKSSKGINNPMFGKRGKEHPAYGRVVTKEQRDKISKSKLGVKRNKDKCPHCCRFISQGISIRWHFDNCKLNPHKENNKIGVYSHIGNCICPHCGTVGKYNKTGTGPSANMTRSHFNNCKNFNPA